MRCSSIDFTISSVTFILITTDVVGSSRCWLPCLHVASSAGPNHEQTSKIGQKCRTCWFSLFLLVYLDSKEREPNQINYRYHRHYRCHHYFRQSIKVFRESLKINIRCESRYDCQSMIRCSQRTKNCSATKQRWSAEILWYRSLTTWLHPKC